MCINCAKNACYFFKLRPNRRNPESFKSHGQQYFVFSDTRLESIYDLNLHTVKDMVMTKNMVIIKRNDNN